ncbi:MAG: hypothetical protein LBT63_01170 [Holosporaceae bacterium]|jgi:DNA repair exonuclease SbcCD ATPase subunit|nr:hypothetical protein [Holosporaceae bacterium]
MEKNIVRGFCSSVALSAALLCGNVQGMNGTPLLPKEVVKTLVGESFAGLEELLISQGAGKRKLPEAKEAMMRGIELSLTVKKSDNHSMPLPRFECGEIFTWLRDLGMSPSTPEILVSQESVEEEILRALNEKMMMRAEEQQEQQQRIARFYEEQRLAREKRIRMRRERRGAAKLELEELQRLCDEDWRLKKMEEETAKKELSLRGDDAEKEKLNQQKEQVKKQREELGKKEEVLCRELENKLGQTDLFWEIININWVKEKEEREERLMAAAEKQQKLDSWDIYIKSFNASQAMKAAEMRQKEVEIWLKLRENAKPELEQLKKLCERDRRLREMEQETAEKELSLGDDVAEKEKLNQQKEQVKKQREELEKEKDELYPKLVSMLGSTSAFYREIAIISRGMKPA